MTRTLRFGILVVLCLGCGAKSEDTVNSTSQADATQPDTAEPQVDLPPVGATYAVGLANAKWAIPPNGADLLALSGFDNGGMIGIESALGNDIELKLGITGDDGQDFCSRTLQITGTKVLADGQFEYGPTVLELSNGTKIENAHLRGFFTSDFSAMKSMRFTGRIDLDTFDTALLPENLAEEKDKLCELIALAANIECEPCTDGRVRCVASDVSQELNPRLDGVVLETVTDANCHSKCAENTPECPLSK